ncbi:pyrroline-5-carboxylate reductase [Adlercreutzia sp. ZJ304]|uniref:pyrroline-5-carboxylate reductase n=1 Tax=Adlercreutzia sp. ZJ304 TaxID=2709791 RepID=UPI0013EAEBC8|nr:pyrroline-5-carboxylate reductase [Adlercreutzia sp. ZJ304]
MNICIIGCGKMGEAILAGWLAAESGAAAALSAQNFVVVGHTQERCDYLAKRYGVRVQRHMNDISDCSIIVLGVKPQVLGEVLDNLSAVLASSQGEVPLVLSIAAGVTTSTIEGKLNSGVRVVRAMPNTPLQVGKGATAVAAGQTAFAEDVRLVCDLFNCLGLAVQVEEDQINAVCALSGAAPAYFALMIEALSAAGADAGLSYETACALLVQSGLGTFDMMCKTNQTPEQVRVSVCSPGGTTLAALAAMQEGGFSSALKDGVRAAMARAKELA